MCPFYLAFVAVIVLIIVLLTCTCSDGPEVIYISGFKEHKDKQHNDVKSPYVSQMPISEVMNNRSHFTDPILSTKPSNDPNTLRANMIKLSAFEEEKYGHLSGFEDRHHRSGFLTQFDTEKLGFQDKKKSGFLTGFDADKSDAPSSFMSNRSSFLTGFDADKSDVASGFASGNSNKLVNGVNFIPNEFSNPNDFYNFGVGGTDLTYM